MAIVVRFTPRNLTPEKYDQTVERVNEEVGEQLPDGCLAHVAFKGSDGSFHVSEIWESQQQFQRFGEKLMPLLAELGIDPGEPQVFEVHNLEMR